MYVYNILYMYIFYKQYITSQEKKFHPKYQFKHRHPNDSVSRSFKMDLKAFKEIKSWSFTTSKTSCSSFISSIMSAGSHECPETDLARVLLRLRRLPTANQGQHISHGGWAAVLWKRLSTQNSKLNIVKQTMCANRITFCQRAVSLRLLQPVRVQLPRLWLPHRGRGQVPGRSRIHLAWHLLCVRGRCRFLSQ